MSFYLTLPSNASMKDFPTNIIADFTTKLTNPIYLEGNWEVGLVEILYPSAILNDISGEMTIQSIIDSGKETERYGDHIGYNVQYTPEETFKSLKYKMKYIMRFYQSQNVQIRFLGDEKALSTTRIAFTPGTIHEIRFEPRMAEVFGFPASVYGNLDYAREIMATSKDQYVEIGELFVYVDIITQQYIGDVKAKVLRIIGIDSASNSKQISKLYDNPHYVPLERNNIDTIKIQIKDKTGRTVRFKNGSVIVKLHFRKSYF